MYFTSLSIDCDYLLSSKLNIFMMIFINQTMPAVQKNPWFYSGAHNPGTLKFCEISVNQWYWSNSCKARLALYWECWNKGKCRRQTLLSRPLWGMDGVCVWPGMMVQTKNSGRWRRTDWSRRFCGRSRTESLEGREHRAHQVRPRNDWH